MGKNLTNASGIQSINRAFFILDHIKSRNSPITLTELQETTQMGMSSLQKYLNSFVTTGALSFDSKRKTYHLGPKLIELGLSAINQLDIISIISPYLEKISEEYNQSSALAVWTEQGPMIIKYQKSKRFINVKVEEGFSPPLLVSSLGKCFAAFLPFEQIKEQFMQEIEEYQLEEQEVFHELKVIRDNRISIRDNQIGTLPGHESISCPVFDHNNDLVAVLGLVGFDQELDTISESPHANWFTDMTQQISMELGYQLKEVFQHKPKA